MLHTQHTPYMSVHMVTLTITVIACYSPVKYCVNYTGYYTYHTRASLSNAIDVTLFHNVGHPLPNCVSAVTLLRAQSNIKCLLIATKKTLDMH